MNWSLAFSLVTLILAGVVLWRAEVCGCQHESWIETVAPIWENCPKHCQGQPEENRCLECCHCVGECMKLPVEQQADCLSTKCGQIC